MDKQKDLIWFCSLEEEKNMKAESVSIEIYSDDNELINIDDLEDVFKSILEHYKKFKFKDQKIIVNLN